MMASFGTMISSHNKRNPMNERNTNRRAQTRSNRTTQRHQIDGRPAPRRQASHASDYSEGAFTQPSHSSTFRTDPRESEQSARSRRQQGRRQQPPQRGQQRPNQRHVSGTEPPRLLVEQVARLSTNSIPTRRSRLAKEPAPTFAMDTRKNAVTCPFSLVEQQPSLSLFFS